MLVLYTVKRNLIYCIIYHTASYCHTGTIFNSFVKDGLTPPLLFLVACFHALKPMKLEAALNMLFRRIGDAVTGIKRKCSRLAAHGLVNYGYMAIGKLIADPT